jgi:putative membrane protein
MALSDNDPRVFFAAERTLLAWLRTGLTIIAIGLVLARFELFVHLLSLQDAAPSDDTHLPALLGVAFVLVGALAILVAVIQHHRFVLTLTGTDLPPHYSRAFALIMALTIALLGLGLAAYLFIDVL